MEEAGFLCDEEGFHFSQDAVQVLGTLCISCVTLRKSLSLSEPQFPNLSSEMTIVSAP